MPARRGWTGLRLSAGANAGLLVPITGGLVMDGRGMAGLAMGGLISSGRMRAGQVRAGQIGGRAPAHASLLPSALARDAANRPLRIPAWQKPMASA
ncbi:hypothetical protein AX761_08325 [Rhizobium sp. 58]|nr:hypothetical protein AX761_08325 [Rhizobium sp. 58]